MKLGRSRCTRATNHSGKKRVGAACCWLVPEKNQEELVADEIDDDDAGGRWLAGVGVGSWALDVELDVEWDRGLILWWFASN